MTKNLSGEIEFEEGKMLKIKFKGEFSFFFINDDLHVLDYDYEIQKVDQSMSPGQGFYFPERGEWVKRIFSVEIQAINSAPCSHLATNFSIECQDRIRGLYKKYINGLKHIGEKILLLEFND